MTANVRAYKADMEFTKHCMVAYGPEHNTDMLIYAANMAGMVCRCCPLSLQSSLSSQQEHAHTLLDTHATSAQAARSAYSTCSP